MDMLSTKLNLIKLISNSTSERFLEGLEYLTKLGNTTSNPPGQIEEAALLQQINRGLSQEEQEKYVSLLQRSVNRTLSSEDQEALSNLIVKVEAFQADRLQGLIKLAALRSISVDELMIKLEITQSDK